MFRKIGSRYYAELTQIKQYLTDVRNGSFYESTVLLPSGKRGTCRYDLCSNKRIKANRVIIISREKGISLSFFHSRCLEALIQDKRIPNIN